MSASFIVTLTSDEHSPVVFFARWEGPAPGPDFAIAIARRDKRAPAGCKAAVREAPPLTTYRKPDAVCSDWALYGALPALKELA